MLHLGVKSTSGGMPLVSVSLQVKGLHYPGATNWSGSMREVSSNLTRGV